MQSSKRITIIGGSFFQRRRSRFADVDADRNSRPTPAVAQFLQTLGNNIRAIIIEAEPIDQCLLFRITKDARLCVSRLRLRRHGSDFYKTEAERFPGRERDAIFVEARGQADRIRKRDPEYRFWFL